MKQEKYWVFIIGFLVVSPLILILLLMIFQGQEDFYPKGDIAIIEIFTIHASHWKQLLGPYSRFLWNHPGPGYFYILLPIYKLFGQSSQSLYSGALLINIMSFLAAILIVYWIGGLSCLLWTSILLVLYIRFYGFLYLINPWTPLVTIMPFMLLLLLCSALAAGKFKTSPIIAMIATFVIQTHIMYLPNVVILVLVSLTSYSSPTIREKLGLKTEVSKGALPWFIISIFLLIVLWIPPILEQINNEPGNLTRLFRFFKSGETHPFIDSFTAVSNQIASLPLFIYSFVLRPLPDIRQAVVSGFLFVIQMALLFPAYRIWIRQGKPACAALCLLGGIEACAALPAIARIRGDILIHLIFWVSVIGLVNWAAIGGAFSSALITTEENKKKQRFGRWTKILFMGIILAAAFSNFDQALKIPASLQPNFDIKALSKSLQSHLSQHPNEKPIIRISSHDTWPVAAGVILQLYKAGMLFSIESEYLFMFGDQFAPTGREEQEILFADNSLQKELNVKPFHKLITQYGDTFIFADIAHSHTEQ